MQDSKKALLQAYDEGQPLISDAEYDKLVAAEDGSDELGTKGNTKHTYRLGSIRKIYDGETDIPNEFLGKNVVRTPKLDGVAIRLSYAGNLTGAATRGDGWYGTDVFSKLNLPVINQRIIFTVADQRNFEVTGELVCPKKFLNSRNIVAGAITHIKDLDDYIARAKEFEFVFIAYDTNLPFDTFTEKLEYLASLGFLTVLDTSLAQNYPTDGYVLRFNDTKYVDSLGFTGNYKNGLLAVKERKAAIESVLLDVVWQVSPKGNVTPVAILDPIEIDGAIISRATLNNPTFLRELIEQEGLGIGSAVGVIRAGEIIPKIVSIISKGQEDIIIPTSCPCCGSTLVDNGAFLVCVNTADCSAQVAKACQTFFSTLGVKGFGIKTSEKFNKLPVEILKLSEGQFIDIIGSTVGKKLYAQVKELKDSGVKQSILLQAMSIPMVGKQVSEMLPNVHTWGDEPDFEKFLGNKKAVAAKLEAWFYLVFPDVWDNEWPLKIVSEEPKIEIKTDITVAVTGSVSGYTRTGLVALLDPLGVAVASTVTKKVSYLICETESSSSTYVKAKSLGIAIVTLAELLEKIKTQS